MGLQVAPPTSDDGPGYTYSRHVFVLFYIFIISCGSFVAGANQVNGAVGLSKGWLQENPFQLFQEISMSLE